MGRSVSLEDSRAKEPLLVAVVGPTASGKSSLGVHLAKQFSGEIVSCDSVAVYREFEIGTAKPSREERARVPHYLIDVADPREAFTAGEYARRARAVVGQIAGRGRLPIVVGGTGLYLRALLDGLFPGPQRSDELRERLHCRATEKGSAYLHGILQRLDAASAVKIHPNDAPKLIRAIEVCIASRGRMSELWEQQGRNALRGFRILRIGLNPPREELYVRINQRAARMFEDGLVTETQAVLQKYSHERAITPIHSLGYKQAMQNLHGKLTLDEAIAAAQQGHRNYAKRQMTWFRREPEITWLLGFGDNPAIREQASELVRLAR